MAAEGYLKEGDVQALMDRPIRLARENAQEEAVAPYPVEEVRKYLYEKYGRDRVLEGGLEVTTTIDSVWQAAANEAVRDGLRAVDRRRGFRKEGVQFVNNPDKTQLPGLEPVLRGGRFGAGRHPGLEARRRRGAHRQGTVLTVPDSAFAWAGKTIRSLLARGAAPAVPGQGRPATTACPPGWSWTRSRKWKAPCWRWSPRPGRSGPWWAATISSAPSSTAPTRRSGRWGPP